jgi:hypothetical protein
VIVDARDLVVSDAVFLALLTDLGREEANRGGTLAVVEPSPPPSAVRPAATPLDLARTSRSVRRGMAEHPAGRARHGTSRADG